MAALKADTIIRAESIPSSPTEFHDRRDRLVGRLGYPLGFEPVKIRATAIHALVELFNNEVAEKTDIEKYSPRLLEIEKDIETLEADYRAALKKAIADELGDDPTQWGNVNPINTVSSLQEKFEEKYKTNFDNTLFTQLYQEILFDFKHDGSRANIEQKHKVAQDYGLMGDFLFSKSTTKSFSENSFINDYNIYPPDEARIVLQNLETIGVLREIKKWHDGKKGYEVLVKNRKEFDEKIKQASAMQEKPHTLTPISEHELEDIADITRVDLDALETGEEKIKFYRENLERLRALRSAFPTMADQSLFSNELSARENLNNLFESDTKFMKSIEDREEYLLDDRILPPADVEVVKQDPHVLIERSDDGTEITSEQRLAALNATLKEKGKPEIREIPSSIHWEDASETVRGWLHKRDELPNQDAKETKEIEYGEGSKARITAVADGHGSHKSVRSEKGAEIAVRVAIEQLEIFAKEVREVEKINKFAQENLPTFLARAWQDAVGRDLVANPLDDEDFAQILKRKSDLSTTEVDSVRKLLGEHPEYAYGSTLLATLAAGDYIVNIQIGDGDIVIVDSEGNVQRPIKKDARLTANETTSLCSEYPEKEIEIMAMRLQKGREPSLIMLSTDGLYNSCKTNASFNQFATDVHAHIVDRQKGIPFVREHLSGWLKEINDEVKGDDITVGLVVAEQKKKSAREEIIRSAVETRAETNVEAVKQLLGDAIAVLESLLVKKEDARVRWVITTVNSAMEEAIKDRQGRMNYKVKFGDDYFFWEGVPVDELIDVLSENDRNDLAGQLKENSMPYCQKHFGGSSWDDVMNGRGRDGDKEKLLARIDLVQEFVQENYMGADKSEEECATIARRVIKDRRELVVTQRPAEEKKLVAPAPGAEPSKKEGVIPERKQAASHETPEEVAAREELERKTEYKRLQAEVSREQGFINIIVQDIEILGDVEAKLGGTKSLFKWPDTDLAAVTAALTDAKTSQEGIILCQAAKKAEVKVRKSVEGKREEIMRSVKQKVDAFLTGCEAASPTPGALELARKIEKIADSRERSVILVAAEKRNWTEITTLIEHARKQEHGAREKALEEIQKGFRNCTNQMKILVAMSEQKKENGEAVYSPEQIKAACEKAKYADIKEVENNADIKGKIGDIVVGLAKGEGVSLEIVNAIAQEFGLSADGAQQVLDACAREDAELRTQASLAVAEKEPKGFFKKVWKSMKPRMKWIVGGIVVAGIAGTAIATGGITAPLMVVAAKVLGPAVVGLGNLKESFKQNKETREAVEAEMTTLRGSVANKEGPRAQEMVHSIMAKLAALKQEQIDGKGGPEYAGTQIKEKWNWYIVHEASAGKLDRSGGAFHDLESAFAEEDRAREKSLENYFVEYCK